MSKKGLLVISFGTTFPETRKNAIEAIENDLKEAFPERTFYRAWTSGVICKKILERDGEKILSPKEALEQIRADGITDLLIQPTHMLAGLEYGKILNALKTEEDKFERVTVGRPLLETEADISEFAAALSGLIPYVKEDELAAFMGHGSNSMPLPVYALLNREFEKTGHANYCVGTVEFDPGIDPVIEKVKGRKPAKVFLLPLLIVAGDHATNDMAGDEADSWKNRITEEGPEVECILKGLGEYPEIRKLYVKRAKEKA